MRIEQNWKILLNEMIYIDLVEVLILSVAKAKPLKLKKIIFDKKMEIKLTYCPPVALATE